MLTKVLMCPCYKDYFIASKEPIVEHWVHFKCKCRRSQKIFVHFCKYHLFGNNFWHIREDSVEEIEDKCFCKKCDANPLCNFCLSACYCLNFRSHKICLNDLPDWMAPRVVPLETFLKKINCEPFFYWNEKDSRVESSLGNPSEPKITTKTDYRLLSRS